MIEIFQPLEGDPRDMPAVWASLSEREIAALAQLHWDADATWMVENARRFLDLAKPDEDFTIMTPSADLQAGASTTRPSGWSDSSSSFATAGSRSIWCRFIRPATWRG